MFVGGVNVDCLLEQRFSVFFFFVALHLKDGSSLCNTLSWEYQNFSYVNIKKHT